LSNIAASGGFGETNTCPPQIAVGSSCTVDVTFTPTVTGQVNGSLTVTDDSGNAGTTQTVALTGVGTGPVATVTPTSLTFSSQPVATTSAAQSVSLQNTGTGSMSISSISASASFTQSNNCGSGIAAGGSCTIMVAFAPTVMGTTSGTLTISDNAGTQTVSLSGTGSAPVTLSTSSLNFGRVTVGKTSTALTVTVTNLQAATLSFSSIKTSGPFAIASNTCGGSIAGGAKCAVGVTFKPTVKGTATGALTFSDNAVNSPQIVTLSGSGR
jgi:hypothetical protein